MLFRSTLVSRRLLMLMLEITLCSRVTTGMNQEYYLLFPTVFYQVDLSLMNVFQSYFYGTGDL